MSVLLEPLPLSRFLTASFPNKFEVRIRRRLWPLPRFGSQYLSASGEKRVWALVRNFTSSHIKPRNESDAFLWLMCFRGWMHFCVYGLERGSERRRESSVTESPCNFLWRTHWTFWVLFSCQTRIGLSRISRLDILPLGSDILSLADLYFLRGPWRDLSPSSDCCAIKSYTDVQGNTLESGNL